LVDLALVANYADQIFRKPTEDGMTIDAVCFSLLQAPLLSCIRVRFHFLLKCPIFRSS
jgi:hypothetical protein